MAEAISLSIIFPIYNERYFFEASLKRILQITHDCLRKIQVIIVDDCSTDLKDGTLERVVAQLPKIQNNTILEWLVIRHEKNMGKGRAIQTAIEHLTGDITIIHDADLEYDPKDIPKILEVFLSEDADAVFGSRFMPAKYKRALYFRHELGNKFLTLLVDLVTDLNLTDVETCYKSVRTGLLKSIPLESNDFCIEVELVIKLAKRKAKIFEVPINYHGRTYEEGKKIKWTDGVLTLLAIAKFAFSDQIFCEDEYGSQILGRLSRAGRFNKWMTDVIRPYVGENVLEIGSGTGNLTRNLLPRSLYYATDINPHYLETLQRLKDGKPFLEVNYLDVTDVSSFPPSSTADTVICMNVLEHVDDDLQALKNIYQILKPGGRAIILVPNGPKLFGSLDSILGHKRRYKKEQLETLGDRAGFQVEKTMGFNRIGSFAWFLNGKVLKRKTFGLGQITILNILTPLFRILEPITPLPPNSWISILRRKGTNETGQKEAEGVEAREAS